MIVEPTTFLQELVTLPSLSGQEEKVAAHLVATMKRLGLEAQLDEAGNAVGVRERPDEDGQVWHETVLLGHMDTVPGEIPVRLEDGCLYGRGSVDAKGPLATFVMAAARTPLSPGRRLVVIGAVEEESATSRGARFVAERYRPDACIIGEPSGWNSVTLGYKGRLLMDYTGEQPMSHTAGPVEGVAEAAVAWWNKIVAYSQEYNQQRARFFDQLLPSIRQIHTESDGLSNRVLLKVGMRLPPDFDTVSFMELARDMAEPAQVKDYGFEPAFSASRQTALVRAFNRTLRQHGGLRYKLKTGTSDMNVVGPCWQCPIVAYGPGDSQFDHTPKEHIVIEEYLQAIDVLTEVLGSL